MKKSYLIAGILAIAVAGWVASGQLNGSQSPQSTAGAPIEPMAAPEHPRMAVRVQELVARERISELVLFGHTEAVRDVYLGAQTTARVVKLEVKKGQAVSKGDTILRLSMDDRRARLREAEAIVEQRRVAYNAAKELSEKNFRSKVKLAEEKAMLESARANLATIQTDIGFTTIEAPFNGIVEELPAKEGVLLQVGDPAARLVDLDPILIVAEVTEREIAQVRVGAQAHAKLPSGEEVSGAVRFVSREGGVATRTFRIEVAVKNAENAIPEGMTSELRIPLQTQRAHLVSPAVLTLSDTGVVGVKALDEENRVVFYPVTLIADTEDGVWLGGLPQRVRLITVGQEFVLPGQTVDAVTGSKDDAPEPDAKGDSVS